MSFEVLKHAEYGCYLLSCGAREELNAIPSLLTQSDLGKVYTGS